MPSWRLGSTGANETNLSSLKRSLLTANELAGAEIPILRSPDRGRVTRSDRLQGQRTRFNRPPSVHRFVRHVHEDLDSCRHLQVLRSVRPTKQRLRLRPTGCQTAGSWAASPRV